MIEDFDSGDWPHLDGRERHIRGLAWLMTKGRNPSREVEEYLQVGEYGLALEALAGEITGCG